MSKKAQWALMVLVLLNAAVLLLALVPVADSLVVGFVLGLGVAHGLHGVYGCDFFPETER